jgi:hypothetical protein|uniref:Uncharacterized protein n=2 Tax=Picea TaxID=3328 RepID=A0A124GMK3_PICGL|nr:hypothetical protein ABT39_MTgene2054 [Picea glauca]QHR92754.1 hypothetical protein Q903MT_gene6802 [Picea sitchensis]
MDVLVIYGWIALFDGMMGADSTQFRSDRTRDGPLIMVVQRGFLLGSFDKVSFIDADLFLHSFSLYRTIRVGAVYRANELEPVDPTSEKVLLSGAKLATAARTTEARVPLRTDTKGTAWCKMHSSARNTPRSTRQGRH